MSTHDGFLAFDSHSNEAARNLLENRVVDIHVQREQNPVSPYLKWSGEPSSKSIFPGIPDLVCFSHLRWDFVYQRPQHLLGRCAQTRRVFFVEEPTASPDDSWWLDISRRECGVWVVVPYLPAGLSEKEASILQQLLLDTLLVEADIQVPILWYYTPMAVPFTYQLKASVVVYDCMDELSAFKGAHPELQLRENHLFKLADLVFTGGLSLSIQASMPFLAALMLLTLRRQEI
jgi:hypothetical protein